MKFPEWLKVFGDTKFRGDCPLEIADQITAIGMIREHHPKLFDVLIHPKNEGVRTARQAAIERQAGGLNKGASDLVFPCSPALVIEIKRQDHTKSRWEGGQIKYLKSCHEQGAFVCVALGWQGVMTAIEAWHTYVSSK